MSIKRTGLILYVKAYKECVHFYAEVLSLSVLFQNEDLTCFDFFGTYLMVEKEDRLDYLEDVSENKNYSCLRINVADVRAVSETLKKQNIKVDYQEHDWGKVAKFKDPEGNLIAFKDEGSFAKQIEDYKSIKDSKTL
ncbi:glyoxalase/bleomycin resistance/dioxygenase family protein [Lacinutrix sp. WUR7]|uniref:VOC family protein n=1 Tax=Lacinutrix sp. WUR7 TaxID=2653681 RepID=UPI00193E24F7|nr:VOC family protein [Lacinutrix sp. WUR7]QRM89395.1 glyoxalase/bleomycin resistance/dioxygenase family protein [Lacinutrix sp. WUR7]